MRYAFLICFLLSLVIGIHPIVVQADPPPLTGEMSRFNFSETQDALSQISLSDASDNEISLTQFRGKIVLLNVWATWCGPCVMEMPSLDKLQASMGTSDLVVMPVSIDRGGAHQAKPFLDRMNVHAMTPYFDRSNSIGRMLNASRIPMTVVIGRDGNEIGRFVGTANWDSDEAKSLLSYFISNDANAARLKYAKSDQVAMTH